MVVNYVPTLYGLMMFHRSLMMLLMMMMIYKMITFHNDGGRCEDKLVHDVIWCECHRFWW
jgi:hypothetical protein